ncbi:MAG: tRNA ((46)-N7)-methyltransferase TrmB [Verrucomicrobiota bacterium]|jgi:tRNA (guanine-N7-)-methyltransferase
MTTPTSTASLLLTLTSITDRLDVPQLFPQAQPLEVELGSGDGSFLVAWAQANPSRNFLAVERLLGRLRKTDRKARRLGLANLRGLRIESAYLLEYLLPPASVSALHLYFPDPWPKRKQQKHRLVQARFPELVRRVLAPGGVVYLRTDHVEYFAQMQEVFAAATDFRAVPTPAELAAVTTDFERQFNAQGIPTNRAAYQPSA